MPPRIYSASLITSIRKAQNDADYYNRYQALLASGLPISTEIGGLIANPQTGNYDASTTTTLNTGLVPQYFKNYGVTTVLTPQQFLPIPRYIPLYPVYIDFIYSFNYTGNDVLQYIPVIQTGSLMISSSYTTDGSANTVRISLLNFNDNGSTNDGISFAGLQGFYNTVTNLTIVQFGSIPLSRGGNQFRELNNIILPTSSPIILSNTSLADCFYGCTTFNSNISGWDTTNVTNMTGLFTDAATFNQPIGSWNTSAVQYMNFLFSGAAAFNQNIGNWNVSNVTGMAHLFENAGSFNQNISGWDVSKVVTMDYMFRNASTFNHPIGSWTTTSLVRTDVMFSNATSFNQDINGWNMSNVCFMNSMFAAATAFNQPLNSWNTSKVTRMDYMFANATAFNQSVSYSTTGPVWDTSGVTDMSGMFYNATNFNNGQADGSGTAPLAWLTTGVTLPVPNFRDGSKLSDPNNLNYNEIPIGVATFIYSFDYSGSNTNILPNVPIILSGALVVSSTYTSVPDGGTTTYTVTVTVISFTDDGSTTDGIQFTNVIATFYNTFTQNLTIQQFGSVPLSRGGSQFRGLDDITILTTSSPIILSNTSLTYCFAQCVAFNSNIGDWDTSNVITMDSMFFESRAFNSSIENWNINNVPNMASMFDGATVFNQPINSWHVDNVTNMTGMFYEATAFNQPINSWNTGTVATMVSMFQGATAFNQPIGNWNTSNVTTMANMFTGATAFNQPIGNWDTSNVTTMANMFSGATAFNQSVSYSATGPVWDTSGVTNMTYMFYNATNFNNGQAFGVNSNPLGWLITNLIGSQLNFLTGSGLSNTLPSNAVDNLGNLIPNNT